MTCHLALVNAVHALLAGTCRLLTSTTTAFGSSSAALITLLRTSRYVQLSSVPERTSMAHPSSDLLADT